MWSWVAHRVTGVLVFFFLFAHVMDTALVRVSPETYDKIVDTYKNPVVNLLEVGLVAAVLFHALNGLRIIAIDFWRKGTRYQRQMLYAEVTLFVILMVPASRSPQVRWPSQAVPNSVRKVWRSMKNAAVLFHALNGLRIIAIDFWRKGTRYQRQMLYAEVTLFGTA